MKIKHGRIIDYLNDKLLSLFSGSVKLSFENGEIVALNEANKHDLPTTKNKKGEQLIRDYIEIATSGNFNGAIVFVFNSGCVTEYSYSRTFKGETLRRFFGE